MVSSGFFLPKSLARIGNIWLGGLELGGAGDHVRAKHLQILKKFGALPRVSKNSINLFSSELLHHEGLSYSPIFGQISGVFKLLPAPADRFHCC